MHVLDTERLRLRWFSTDDAAFVLEMLNEPAWIQGVGDRGVRTLDGARAYIEGRFVEGYRRDGMGFWAAERRADGELVGGCGLLRRTYLPDPDVGYGFLRRFWGHGYAREAARACLEHGVRAFGLTRIFGIVDPANARSIEVLRSLGMTLEDTRVIEGEETPVHVFAWRRPVEIAPGVTSPDGGR